MSGHGYIAIHTELIRKVKNEKKEIHSLKERILKVVQKATECDEQGSPGAILCEYLNANLEGTLDERAAELASFGEFFGDGALGGINVYERDDGKTVVEWTLSDNSTWMTLEGILLAAEDDDWDEVPSWFDDDWIEVSDGLGNWISKGKLRYEEKRAELTSRYSNESQY